MGRLSVVQQNLSRETQDEQLLSGPQDRPDACMKVTRERVVEKARWSSHLHNHAHTREKLVDQALRVAIGLVRLLHAATDALGGGKSTRSFAPLPGSLTGLVPVRKHWSLIA